MSSQTTSALGLHVWEPGDDFLRAEFNENFAELDKVPRFVIGSYTGDGNASQTITLGFQPKMVLITYLGAPNSGNTSLGGVIYPGGASKGAAVTAEGFRAYYTSGDTSVRGNEKNRTYWYTALY